GTGFWAVRFFQDMHDTNPSNNIRLVNMELHGGLDNNDGSNNTGISASAGLPDTPGASGSSFWYVGNNLIHHLGEGAVAGQNFNSYCMYFPARDSIIEHNELHDCSGYGITHHNHNGTGHNNIDRYNKIYHNGRMAGGGSSGLPGLSIAVGGTNNQ